MISIRALIISVLCHLLLIWALWEQSQDREPLQATTVPIEVQYKKPPQVAQRIQQLQLPKNLLKEDDSNELAHALSQLRQRVKQQMQAMRSGQTQNQNSMTPLLQQKNKQLQQEREAAKKEHENPNSANKDGDMAVVQNKKQNSKSKPLLLPRGFSTSTQRLENIKFGEMTALNTDHDLYYSFYSRLENGLYPRWSENIYSAIDQISRTGRSNKNSGDTHVSVIEFILDSKGNFVRYIVDQKSSYPDFERAAIAAFQQAAPFVNPPKEMIKSDGYIHVHYSFVVYWQPGTHF